MSTRITYPVSAARSRVAEPRMRRRMLLGAAAVAALTLPFMGGQAGATSTARSDVPGAAPTKASPTVTREIAYPVGVTGAQACSGRVFPLYRYGYYGEALCGTWIMDVDWNADGTLDETFVIAPNRTIWHAWPGSGGWYEMPGKGLADDTGIAYWFGADRRVTVWVAGHGIWCNADVAGPAGWTGWWPC